MAQATAPILDSTKCDLRAALTNVRSWERNGLSAEVAIGPFMTRTGHRPGEQTHGALKSVRWHALGRLIRLSRDR